MDLAIIWEKGCFAVIKFQERLKKLRKEKGMKQSELAEAIGVTMYTVSLWERGQRTPENKALKKLAEFFGVSISYLVGSSYARDDSFEEHQAYWLDSEDFLEHMFEKIARLSDDSRLVIQEMANKLFIADEATDKLKPEGDISVIVKRKTE